jgi:hypothetical protein
MEIHRRVDLEPIYVVGSHEEFVAAIGNKLTEVLDGADLTTLRVTNVSHTLAIDSSGQMHWSALISMETTRERG